MYSDQLLLNVFDTEFNPIAIIDDYTSLIWTEKYQEVGDFELELCYDKKWKDILKQDYYCRIDPSERTMIIEKVQIEHDDDGLSVMTVSGRSVECILERRIVWKKRTFGTTTNSETHESTRTTVNIQDSIKTLFNDNIISPENTNRKISNFKFVASEDSYIKNLKFNQDYDGDSMLDVIEDLCSDKRMGYKILMDDDNNFNFQFYRGTDRSMEQSNNEVVIFSENYDNLISSEYYSDKTEFFNTMYVTKSDSSGSGSSKTEVNLDASPAQGLTRRETTCSESDLQSKYKTSDNNSLSTDAKKSKGRIKLKKDYKIKEVMEGDISYESMFVYPDDYQVGDKVQFIDIYGNNRAMTVTEMVIGRDDSGYTMIPTFEDVEEGYDPDLDTE